MRAIERPLSLLFAALALAAPTGCAETKCKPPGPGFELVVSAARLDREVRSLDVVVALGTDRRRRTFDLAGELADGTTSLWVQLDPPPVGAFTVRLDATAFAEPRALGAPLASASGEFRGEDALCNRFELTLAGDATDAGLPPHPDAAPLDATLSPDGGLPPDGGTGDASAPDATAADAADADAAPADAGARDGALADGGVPDAMTGCVELTDRDTRALYRFQSNLADETGAHPGSLGGMNVAYGAGRRGCGSALVFPQAGNLQGWARIPDSPDFDLAEGSVDLWLYVDDTPPFASALGVLSRDGAGLSAEGEFSLYVSCEGPLVAKLEAGGVAYHQCSNLPLRASTWSYALVNFGPPGLELWLDGARGTSAATLHVGDDCDVAVSCGTSTSHGLDGNDAPWVLGASADAANVGAPAPTPLHLPFRKGRIDSLRMSAVRR